jgi:hypothetical protein
MVTIKDVPAAIITDPVHAELRSAVNIKKALDKINWLQQLGYCPTKVQQFRKKFELDDRDDSHSSDSSPEKKFRSRDLANQVCKKPDSVL